MTFEEQYIENLNRILLTGTRELNKRTGKETLRLPCTQFVVDLKKDLPILRSKKVNWKTAVDEMLWIMQKNSNNIENLNSKIWDQWAGPDGSIGKTYGFQAGKSITKDGKTYKNQIDYILSTLESDSSNRQCVIDFWDVDDLGEMNLVPCTYSSIWTLIDNKLNCVLIQRSADYPVGVPFDTLQYAILTHLFARHLGVEVGTLTHIMADSHIYADQIEGVTQQLRQYMQLKKKTGPKPKLVLSGPKNFYLITADNIMIQDYLPEPAIVFPVAK